MTVVLGVLVGLGAVGLHRLTSMHVPFVSDTCRVYSDERVVRFNPDQLGNAATISAVGVQRRLPERAVTIALATALQESKLRNLTTGDRDSVGLFQQRPSQGWGTPEQLRDPRYASNAFYNRLLRVTGWQDMRLTEAAQAVQRSAYPFEYQKWEDEARTMARAFLGSATSAVTCRLRERTDETGDDTVKAMVAELSQDLGKLSVAAKPANTKEQLSVAVGGGSGSTLGWRTAHWFVAKSKAYGVRRVAYGGMEWTSSSGKWKDEAGASAATVDVTLAP